MSLPWIIHGQLFGLAASVYLAESPLPIEDLARSDVVTADPETPVADLAATMDQAGVGCLVITDGDTPVGIVTDRDLTVRVLAGGRDQTGLTAENVMTEDLLTVERDAGFYEATTMLAEHGVRRLPVRTGDDLVWIITGDDFTELLADEQAQFADVIRAQRPEY